MKAFKKTLNIPLEGRMIVDSNYAVFNLYGAGDVLTEAVRTFSIDSLTKIFEEFKSELPESIPLFIKSSGGIPHSLDAAIIAQRPAEYFTHIGDYSGPWNGEIPVIPGLNLTIADAYIYVAAVLVEDDAIKQSIIITADTMIDCGWPLTQRIPSIRFPAEFLALRSKFEANAIQNGIRCVTKSAVAESI
jgi:hypothetical protein